jgi:hypothetical protein
LNGIGGVPPSPVERIAVSILWYPTEPATLIAPISQMGEQSGMATLADQQVITTLAPETQIFGVESFRKDFIDCVATVEEEVALLGAIGVAKQAELAIERSEPLSINRAFTHSLFEILIRHDSSSPPALTRAARRTAAVVDERCAFPCVPPTNSRRDSLARSGVRERPSMLGQ